MNKESLVSDFLRYINIDTKSDSQSGVRPSTAKQLNLLNILNDELLTLGLEVDYDNDNGYIYAKLSGNNSTAKSVGFLAHVDTAPDMSGKDVKPQIIENYDGGIIKLNDEYNLDPNEFNSLNNYINQTLITTSGDTLLGADDKAGISIIMQILKYYTANPDIARGDIWVSFTTDEEIGTGVDKFDVNKFNVDFAYTVDGGEIGEFQYENFNAAGVKIDIYGKNVHPGTAKNTMINSAEIAIKLHNSLPLEQKPELTERYEGFFMLNHMECSVDKSTLNYIIRDHDKIKFEEKKQYIQNVFDAVVKPLSFKSNIEIKDQYYNMYEEVKKKQYVLDIGIEAIKMSGITPNVDPIRGGTDGARLSFMGIVCPNIFTGGHNFHGRYEYICVESMLKSVEVLRNIVTLTNDL